VSSQAKACATEARYSIDMPTLRQMAAVFFRIGNTTLGGGDPTIAVLQREFDRRRWITPEQFALVFGLSRVTPFTTLLAFCAGSAWFMIGVLGAIVAVLVVTIPSAALVIWLTHVCALGGTNRWAQAAISGTVAAAVGTMLAATLSLVRPQLGKSNWFASAIVVIAAFVLSRTFALSPVQILGLAAVAGFFWTARS
jgi:chromate transporter